MKGKETVLIPAILALTGCANIYNPYKNMSLAERTWQGMHIVDVGQTLSVAKDNCYSESNPITRSLIGKKPSKGSVLLWGAGLSYVHAAGSKWLDKTDAFSDKTKKLIRIFDLGLKFNTIHSNYSIGLNFSTSDNDVDELCRAK